MKIHYPNSPEAPAGAPTLRLDQLEAIYRIKREVTDPARTGSALVGAGMGSGKTVVSVEVILHTKPKRCLVIGVRDAYSQWEKTLREQQPAGGSLTFLRIDDTEQGQRNLEKLLGGDDGLYYVGLQMLRAKDWKTVSETHPVHPDIKAFFGEEIGDETEPMKRRVQKKTYASMKPLDLLISDEAHKHSNRNANGLKTIKTIKTRGKVALSGTFYGNKFENSHTVAEWLWGRSVVGTKSEWEQEWCVRVPVMSKDGRRQLTTSYGTPINKIIGERNPGEFVQSLPCYVFIATPIGPPPEPEIVLIDLHPEQFRQYREMEEQSLTWIPSAVSEDHAPLVADIPLTQRNRLRTAALGGMTLVPGKSEDDPDSITFQPGCKSSTLTAAHHVLHRPTWVGKKALILTHSKQFAIETARRISQKYPTALKTGDTKPDQWERDKAAFMLPPSDPNSIQYLVAVITAVGTATDGLQANCAKVLWLSEEDSNVDNIQGANRVWRDGVDLAEYEAVKLVARNTIAQGVLAKNVAHKETLLDSVKGAG